VKCPQCGQPLAAGADARWRPFCSERCKLADLGQWFAGRYAIPAQDDADDATAPAPPQDPTPRQ
jgi:endogenous inhibitor of DNA gyrase (YacG/DUF329 family)